MAEPIDVRHLRTLEAVVRLRSFAGAARELGYTQSAVSQQIAALERRTGARVVARRPVRATAAGDVLLAAEVAVAATLSGAAAELAALDEGTTGTVRLGAFVSAAYSLVPPALRRFRASNPGVHLMLASSRPPTATTRCCVASSTWPSPSTTTSGRNPSRTVCAAR